MFAFHPSLNNWEKFKKMYGRSRGYGGYRSGYGYGSSLSYGIGQSSSGGYSKQTYPKPQQQQQQQQQGIPTYKQKYSQTPRSNQYGQSDRGKSQNYKPTTSSNQYKKKTVNKTVNINQQPRRNRWGLGGFRNMWHIPMIFMCWRGFSRNRHQPPPPQPPQPAQQNQPVNVINVNYPPAPENTSTPAQHPQLVTNIPEESLPKSSQNTNPKHDENHSISSYHSAEEEKNVDGYDNNVVPPLHTQS